MRSTTFALILCLVATPAYGQRTVDVSYGVDRNVDSGTPQTDAALSAVVEWGAVAGLNLGLGTDHQFEGPSLNPDGHLAWAVYLSVSRRHEAGRLAPFVRGGIGLGRAPCEQDTCGDGLYVRASVGATLHVSGPVHVLGEVGLSRVSRPIAGVGVSVKPREWVDRER